MGKWVLITAQLALRMEFPGSTPSLQQLFRTGLLHQNKPQRYSRVHWHATKLRSLLPTFQTKIATTQTMMASKWRKEAHVFFAATVMFPDFCADKTSFFQTFKKHSVKFSNLGSKVTFETTICWSKK